MWEENIKSRIKPVRKTYKELSWVYRNPRTFVIITSSFALLTLFSKPIYEALFVEKVAVDPKYLKDPELRKILEENMNL